MKVIEDGNTIRIVHGTRVTDDLPAEVYLMCWTKREGHFLIRQPTVQGVTKMFGPMANKHKKVFKAFERRDCNTGVILSGDKGLGKSLFCRHLMKECLDHGIPVIIVRDLLPGVASFIQSITQPAMYVFDEFEKIFTKDDDDNNPEVPDNQVQFLSLLDGTGGDKRLFVITCNNLWKISEYFLDRPGRFYYQLTFTPPDGPTVLKYMKHLGVKIKVDDMTKLSNIASFMSLNYDSLRAIAEELKAGYGLDESLKDLNIRGGGNTKKTLSVRVTLNTGEVLTNNDEDTFDPSNDVFYLHLYTNSITESWPIPAAMGNINLSRMVFVRMDETGDAIFTVNNVNDFHSFQWSSYGVSKLKKNEKEKLVIKNIEIRLVPREERNALFRAERVYSF